MSRATKIARPMMWFRNSHQSLLWLALFLCVAWQWPTLEAWQPNGGQYCKNHSGGGNAQRLFLPKTAPTTTTRRTKTSIKSAIDPYVERNTRQVANTINARNFQQQRDTYQDTLEQVLELTNVERRRHGLQELRYNRELAKAAQMHAEDMAKNNYMSHTGRDGSDIAQRVLTLTEYQFKNVGENLYCRWPYNEPQAAVQGWMESPGHRKNLLQHDFQEIGLGYAKGRESENTVWKHYYVQVFGIPVAGPRVEGEHATRQVLLQLTQQARSQFARHLPPLNPSRQLEEAAQRHAEEMARTGDLLSTPGTAPSLEDHLLSTGYTYKTFAASFAYRAPFNDPHGVFRDWLVGDANKKSRAPETTLSSSKSLCHILDQSFSNIGYGYAVSPARTREGGQKHYYVQLLGTPTSGPAVNGEEPTRAVLFHLTNQARLVRGLPPLHNSDQLNYAAQRHAERLAQYGVVSDAGLEQTITATGYPGESFAANVNDRGPVNDPQDIFEDWLHQPNGYSYVLDSSFTDVGHGYGKMATAEGWQHFYVQVFGVSHQGLDYRSAARNHPHHHTDFRQIYPNQPYKNNLSGGRGRLRRDGPLSVPRWQPSFFKPDQ